MTINKYHGGPQIQHVDGFGAERAQGAAAGEDPHERCRVKGMAAPRYGGSYGGREIGRGGGG